MCLGLANGYIKNDNGNGKTYAELKEKYFPEESKKVSKCEGVGTDVTGISKGCERNDGC